ncbi:MAG: hypothetical protein GY850_33100 [bacterium]|nr:hypothetical protein [bacterium]
MKAFKSDLDLWIGTISIFDFMQGGLREIQPKKNLVFDSFEEVAEYESKKKHRPKFTAGAPARLYTLNMEAIGRSDNETELRSALEPMDSWYLPVYIDGRTVSTAWVQCTDSGMKIIGIQGKSAAIQLDTLRNRGGDVEGSHKIVKIPRTMSEFIVVDQKQDGGQLFYPLNHHNQYRNMETADEHGGYAPGAIIEIIYKSMERSPFF